MNWERLRDERDLAILYAMDFPPRGAGMSQTEAADYINRHFPELEPITRNAVAGRFRRLMEEAA